MLQRRGAGGGYDFVNTGDLKYTLLKTLNSEAFCPCLRGSLPNSGPLDFATKNTFPLFFVSEEALVGIY